MKHILILTAVFLYFGCNTVEKKEPIKTPNMEYGGFSGILDDSSKESVMTRELMDKYIANNFKEISYMVSENGDYYFNQAKGDKESWLSIAEAHHSLFENISNSKNNPPIVTTARYDNGSVWSMAWFYWSGKGRTTGKEVSIPVHHGFKFENDSIVEAYHFFDPTELNIEIAAQEASK